MGFARYVRHISMLLATAIIVGACTSAAPSVLGDVSDERLLEVVAPWSERAGFNERDPALWRTRLEDVCRAGQDSDALISLASGYAAADDRRFPEVQPNAQHAANVLWELARSVCPDSLASDPPIPPEEMTTFALDGLECLNDLFVNTHGDFEEGVQGVSVDSILGDFEQSPDFRTQRLPADVKAEVELLAGLPLRVVYRSDGRVVVLLRLMAAGDGYLLSSYSACGPLG